MSDVNIKTNLSHLNVRNVIENFRKKGEMIIGMKEIVDILNKNTDDLSIRSLKNLDLLVDDLHQIGFCILFKNLNLSFFSTTLSSSKSSQKNLSFVKQFFLFFLLFFYYLFLFYFILMEFQL